MNITAITLASHPDFAKFLRTVIKNVKKRCSKFSDSPQNIMHTLVQRAFVEIPEAIRLGLCKRYDHTVSTILDEKGHLKLEGARCKSIVLEITL